MTSISSFLVVLLVAAAAAPAWSSPQPSPRCPPSDLHALLSVKQSLGNPKTLSTWSQASAECCAWDHVRCDEAGRVNNVFIDGADDVHGQIPSAVAGLTALMSLSLFRLPGLTGTIPACLTALSKLQFLTISHTNVSGTIPDSLARLRSLDSVDLSNNKLTGPIPNSFADLPNLRSLDLRHNQLTGPIPAGLVQGEFRSLILSYNQLTGPIPRDEAKDEINTVDLSHNKLTGDASHLFVQGRPIGKVDLSWNNLDFDLSKLEFPPELTYLDLSHNRIRGTVPPSLARLSTLQKLDLSYNLLCGPLPKYHGVMRHGCKPYEHNQCLRGAPIETCHQL
ncbi:polygalacturonase inhibitor 1-like [Phragmites australis]|uniref:polygalacturonase inhibitor 1-like n=1 Tax=Phragmites australis TaxID=29695 RepID=UPI002D79CACF|nr:polygalacturonase inhibitor 1-like [Phragmites australis]